GFWIPKEPRRPGRRGPRGRCLPVARNWYSSWQGRRPGRGRLLEPEGEQGLQREVGDDQAEDDVAGEGDDAVWPSEQRHHHRHLDELRTERDGARGRDLP